MAAETIGPHARKAGPDGERPPHARRQCEEKFRGILLLPRSSLKHRRIPDTGGYRSYFPQEGKHLVLTPGMISL